MNIARLTLRGLATSKATRFRDEIERMRGKTNLTADWLYNRMRKLLLPGNYIACETCGMSTIWDGITIDHKIPRTAHKSYKGNIHSVENLELVCPTCNSWKGQKNLAEFLDDLTSWNEHILQLRKTASKKDIIAPYLPQVGLGTRIFGSDTPNNRGGRRIPRKPRKRGKRRRS